MAPSLAWSMPVLVALTYGCATPSFAPIVPAEVADHHRSFIARLDADGDGYLSFEERIAEPMESFACLDRNGDGAIDARELRRAPLPGRTGCNAGDLGARVPRPKLQPGVVI